MGAVHSKNYNLFAEKCVIQREYILYTVNIVSTLIKNSLTALCKMLQILN